MYFQHIKSFDDLKKQYRKLAIQYHPDQGGDERTMKAINGEYDVVFPLWQRRYNETAPEKSTETAHHDRWEFYTQNGWKGTRYNSDLSTTEIAKLIREYAKKAYPEYKFSVTRDYFSGGSSIHVALMEAPHPIFQEGKEPKDGYVQSADAYFEQRRWAFGDQPRVVLTDSAITVLKDIQQFMNSYNMEDIDSMIDYFHVKFWSHLDIGKWNKPFQVVERKARIPVNKNPPEIHHYTISPDVDTRDGSSIYVVKLMLHYENFNILQSQMKEMGGYYSRFKHGFIFREDPTDKLKKLSLSDPSHAKQTALPADSEKRCRQNKRRGR